MSSHTLKVRLLYKTILKLHRGLPEELKQLGDEYTRSEFKRHKSCSVQEANIFMSTWADYAINLAQQLGMKGKPPTKKLGLTIDNSLLEEMREEQLAQLYELLKASQGIEDEEKRKT